MPIAKESGGNFEPVPAGSHIARCFAVISLGTQHSPQFADSFKVMLMWEVPSERVTVEDKDVPMTISKEYTLSLSEKANLRRDLEGWRGREFSADELKGFDVAKVLGHPCIINVVHKTSGKGKLYAAIASVSKLGAKMECDPQVHASVHYEIEDGRNKVFETLPEWVSKKIALCEEWSAPRVVTPMASAPTDDEADGGSEVPF